MAEVSCVIPTHGRDALLAEAIGSVVAQDLTPARLVVCDDVGSATTREVVARWAARAPFPVAYQDTSGTGFGTAGASRNAGALPIGSGLLAFLDDDDVWEPAFLRSLVGALTTADADFAVGWTEADAGGGTYRIAKMPPGLTAPQVVARNPGFVGSNFVMRAEAFASLGGFDPPLTVANDKDLLVRALAAGLRYVVVPEVLLHNRIHAGAQLTDRTPRRLDGIVRYMDKHAALLSAQDRRYLRAQVLSVRRVTEATALGRFLCGVRLAKERATYALVARR